jgi:hypothetical protein
MPEASTELNTKDLLEQLSTEYKILQDYRRL